MSEFEFGFEFEFEFFFFVADATFGCYRTTLWRRRCCSGRVVLCVAWLRNMPSLRHFGLCLAVPGFHTLGTDTKPKRWCRGWAPVRGPAGTHTIADPPGGCCCRPTVASRCCGCGCSECWFSEIICALLCGAQLLSVFRPSGASLKLGQLTRRRRCLVGCSTPR